LKHTLDAIVSSEFRLASTEVVSMRRRQGHVPSVRRMGCVAPSGFHPHDVFSARLQSAVAT